MTQDKAPEWAMNKAAALVGVEMLDLRRSMQHDLALALSQAYERGQVDMRERAAKACDGIAGNSADFDQRYRRGAGNCSNAIRSLPIEQERKP